jgi:4-amino-4-deoxy-L-arabinose transferase-like glycosyltransferase
MGRSSQRKRFFNRGDNEANSQVPGFRALGILALATLVGLIPFIDKAFCIDDPLFLWVAEQIQAHPLDFYGRQVNWFSTLTPLYVATKNPPLASYYLALVARLVGWDEPQLHAALLVPALGALCGTWWLARSFCRQRVSAAIAVLATPAFLVSSTNLMCDTMLLCIWTWAAALWVKGLEAGQWRWLVLAAVLIPAATFTKYFGMCLLPLLAVYTVARARKPTWQLAWLLLPLAVLAGYQWWTWHRYGRGLLSDAAIYSANAPSVRGSWLEVAGSKTIIALAYTGGSFLPVICCAPWFLSRRGLGATAGLVALITICLKGISSHRALVALHMSHEFTWSIAVQTALLTTCGVLILWMALRTVVKDRTAEHWLMALWILGTFTFAGFLNWTCNVRSLLPMAPAVAILLVQRLEESADARTVKLLNWRWGLAPAAAVAFFVALADMSLANSARDAAMQISTEVRPKTRTVWFQGHWGFQYYMQLNGARAIDMAALALDPGDAVVTPFNNTNIYAFPPEAVEPVEDFAFPVCGWLSTLQAGIGADFYSSDVGPLPFAFGPVLPERYRVWRVKRSVHVQGSS